MRVIAGVAKGRRLKGPPARSLREPSAGTRPSSDLVRGAMFSALSSMNADMSRVLDLYAGSGALGIEALSRGAQHCDFIERNRTACEVIRENLRLTGFEKDAEVHCFDAGRAIERLEGVYTLVLADPPYADNQATAVIAALAGSDLVQAGTTVIVWEHGARDEPAAALGPFSLSSARRHGDSAVSIYR